jgi:DNA primase
MTTSLDESNEELIVVEGMMDFLTVAQYTNNVV